MPDGNRSSRPSTELKSLMDPLRGWSYAETLGEVRKIGGLDTHPTS